MKSPIAAILVAVAVAAIPAAALAAPPHAGSTKPASAKSAEVGNHSTTGVVESINDTALVIKRSGKDAGEMRFTLEGATQRSGKIEVGTSVSVRYRDDGKNHVATAIAAEPTSQAKR